MTTTTTNKTIKSSVSFRKHNWERLENSRNKSKTINEALDFFFDFQNKLKETENDFYSKMLDEALHDVDRWDITPMPMKNGKLDVKAFEKELWK